MREMLEYDLQGYELRDQEKHAICKEIVMKHCYFAQQYRTEKMEFVQSYLRWVVFKKSLD